MSALLPTPTRTASAPRLWKLDAARVPAAFAIVAFHSLPAHAADPSMFWIGWVRHLGVVGVDLFFFLSGFGTHLSFVRRQAQGKPNIRWKEFFARRFWRLYPAYLAAIIFSVGFAVCFRVIRGHGGGALPSYANLTSHLLLLHTLASDTFFGIVPALWFVGVLAQFYLLYPVFTTLARRFGTDTALGAVLAATLLYRWAAWRLHLGADPARELVWWMNAPALWFDWVFGAWMAWAWHEGRRTPILLKWASVPLAVGWIWLGGSWRVIYDPLLTALLGVAAWSWLMGKGRPSWSGVSLVRLGEISYAFYLLHQIFIPYLISAAAKTPLPVAVLWSLVCLEAVVMTLPLAYLLHRYIEIPLSNGWTHHRAASQQAEAR